MSRYREPIAYAKAAIATMMRTYRAGELPPRGHFHYHQGVFLSGVYENYLICREEAYFAYIREWVDTVIGEDGQILDYAPGHLDDIQPGNLLFPLYERYGEEKYKNALKHLMGLLENFPRNKEGGFWHMDIFPNEMWLDGLYMAGPISARYARTFQHPEYLRLAARQALLMEEKTRDADTGLWHHAWDSEKKADWADPVTGRSPEVWGRSVGWVPVAVLDELDCTPSDDPDRRALCRLVRELLEAVCRFQSKEGRWYQVLDKGGREGNWLENSCSCLFAAAIAKAVRTGVLPGEYLENAERAFCAVIDSLKWKGEDIQIGEVCIGTGVGDYAHYCARPVSVNDLHGVGAFLLMCAEMQRVLSAGGDI